MIATAWARLSDLYSGLVGMVTSAVQRSSSSFGETLVLPPRDKGDRPRLGVRDQLRGRGPGPVDRPLGCPLPRRQRQRPGTVRDRRFERVVNRDLLDQIPGIVRDALDPPGVEDLRGDQPDLGETEIFRDPDRTADVDDVLRSDQDKDGGGLHARQYHWGRGGPRRGRPAPDRPYPGTTCASTSIRSLSANGLERTGRAASCRKREASGDRTSPVMKMSWSIAGECIPCSLR